MLNHVSLLARSWLYLSLMLGPTQSKNSVFQLTGTSSGAYYGNAPENYRVDNVFYNLLCLYGKTASGQVSSVLKVT
jgi:hypothetical protein